MQVRDAPSTATATFSFVRSYLDSNSNRCSAALLFSIAVVTAVFQERASESSWVLRYWYHDRWRVSVVVEAEVDELGLMGR